MLVRAICLNYKDRPKHEQEKIRRLCDKCGGAYSAALFRVMTTEDSITKISLEYNVSQSRLYDFRRDFYESWFKQNNRKN